MRFIPGKLRQNPCFCIPLRAATLVLGSFEVIVYGFGVILYAILLGNAIFLYNKNLPAFLDTMVDEGGAVMTAKNGTETIILNQEPVLKVNDVFISLSIKAVVLFARLVVAIVLIIGVQKSNVKLLQSWILVQVACLIINGCLLMGYIIMFDTTNIIWAVTSILISFYCMFLVQSFVDSIERKSSKPENEKGEKL